MNRTKTNTAAILSIAAATLLTLAICTAGLTTTVFAQQNFNSFTAKLSGTNEVPPVATAALGIAILHTLHVGHQQVINYELHQHIRGVTGAHIHIGNRGENGPVVAGLFNPSMNGPPTGAINGLLSPGTLTSSELTGPLAGKTIGNLLVIIRGGGAYVNIHTTQNRNGEVRGQIS